MLRALLSLTLLLCAVVVASMEWPALLGVDKDVAVAQIKAEQPSFTVLAVPENSMVTMDFREDRVRVFYNAAGKVASVPRTG